MRTRLLLLLLAALPTVLASPSGPYALDSKESSCSAPTPLHAETCLLAAHKGRVGIVSCEADACLLAVTLASRGASDTAASLRLTACVTYDNAGMCERGPFADVCLGCPPSFPVLLCEDTTTQTTLACESDARVRVYVDPGWCTHLSVVTAVRVEEILGARASTGSDGSNSFGLCRDETGAPLFTPYWG